MKKFLTQALNYPVNLTARIIGGLATLIILSFLQGDEISNIIHSRQSEVYIFFSILFANIFGYVFSFFKIKIGAILMLVASTIMFCYFLIMKDINSDLPIALFYSLPYFLNGFGLLISKKYED